MIILYMNVYMIVYVLCINDYDYTYLSFYSYIYIYTFKLIYSHTCICAYCIYIYNQNLTPYIIKIIIFISITIRNKMGNGSLYEHKAGVRQQGKPSGRW